MRSLEEVREYLEEVGVSSDSVGAVYGFLYADNLISLGDDLDYTETKKTFGDFVNWYEEEEEEECSDEEMDGGVFNDKAVINDYIFDCADKIIQYLKLIRDTTNSKLNDNSAEFMNLVQIKEYIEATSFILDELTKEVCDMHDNLNSVVEEENDKDNDTL